MDGFQKSYVEWIQPDTESALFIIPFIQISWIVQTNL